MNAASSPGTPSLSPRMMGVLPEPTGSRVDRRRREVIVGPAEDPRLGQAAGIVERGEEVRGEQLIGPIAVEVDGVHRIGDGRWIGDRLEPRARRRRGRGHARRRQHSRASSGSANERLAHERDPLAPVDPADAASRTGGRRTRPRACPAAPGTAVTGDAAGAPAAAGLAATPRRTAAPLRAADQAHDLGAPSPSRSAATAWSVGGHRAGRSPRARRAPRTTASGAGGGSAAAAGDQHGERRGESQREHRSEHTLGLLA